MSLPGSGVSAGPGEAQVVLRAPPPRVWSKGQGRALDLGGACSRLNAWGRGLGGAGLRADPAALRKESSL